MPIRVPLARVKRYTQTLNLPTAPPSNVLRDRNGEPLIDRAGSYLTHKQGA